MTKSQGFLANARRAAGDGVRCIGRGIAAAVAVVAMLVIYAASSIGTVGLGALGFTTAGLTLASTAQPAQAHRRRRRRRRWGRGWGRGIYFHIGPRWRRRRRRRHWRGWGYRRHYHRGWRRYRY
jgi:hypothetical protein